MLRVDDIVAELDVRALDVAPFDPMRVFGDEALAAVADKRRLAVQDFIQPALEGHGYNVARHMTRRAPEVAWGYTASAYTTETTTLSDKTVDDLDLNAVLVTPGTDALYLASTKPFRGVWLGMLDSVNTTASVSSMTYWDGGRWAGFESYDDQTIVTAGKALSGGGLVQWLLPGNWSPRPVPSTATTWLFWVRLQTSARPSAATTLTQALPIRRSRLTLPAAYQTLALLYDEAWGASRGDWKEKAAIYFKRADDALQLVIGLMADEFDTDESGAVTTEDAAGATADPQNDTTWSRG